MLIFVVVVDDDGGDGGRSAGTAGRHGTVDDSSHEDAVSNPTMTTSIQSSFTDSRHEKRSGLYLGSFQRKTRASHHLEAMIGLISLIVRSFVRSGFAGNV